jgi:flavin-dependent dehydrogenase
MKADVVIVGGGIVGLVAERVTSQFFSEVRR